MPTNQPYKHPYDIIRGEVISPPPVKKETTNKKRSSRALFDLIGKEPESDKTPRPHIEAFLSKQTDPLSTIRKQFISDESTIKAVESPTGQVIGNLAKYPFGKVEGTQLPQHFKETYGSLPEQMQKAHKFAMTGDPGYYDPRSLDIAGDAIVGGAPGAATGASSLGVLNLPPGKAKVVRQKMKRELVRRGPPTGDTFFENLLRGTWYRGSKSTKYPKPGETHEKVRIKPGNEGEPNGLSLTFNPNVAEYRFAEPRNLHSIVNQKRSAVHEKLLQLEDQQHAANLAADYAMPQEKWERLTRAFNTEKRKLEKQLSALTKAEEKLPSHAPTEIGRVMPKFDGPPVEKVLPIWEPWTHPVVQKVYVDALRKQPQLWQGENLRPNFRSHLGITQLNADLSKGFLDEGWKGATYGTERYGEYELRMFDPKDVLHLDKRTGDFPGIRAKKPNSPQTIGRPKTARLAEYEERTYLVPSSWGDIYNKIDFSQITKTPPKSPYIASDFVPTPPRVAEEMVRLATEGRQTTSILKPHGGHGHLASEITKQTGQPPTILEIDPSRYARLHMKGHKVAGQDLLKHFDKYDTIAMKPPWSRSQYRDHIAHAYGLLKPGGRLVALVPDRGLLPNAAKEWHAWLKSVGARKSEQQYKIQTGFMSAVSGRILIIDKPALVGPVAMKVQQTPPHIKQKVIEDSKLRGLA